MKIIEITDALNNGGGVNSFVFDLCEAMANLGHDIYLIGILKSKVDQESIDELKKVGVKIISLDISNKKEAIIKHIPKLRKYIDKISNGEATILNLHLKLSVLMGALASVGNRNVMCVETYHNTYHNYHLQFFLLQPLIKRYICVSKEAENEMHRRFRAPKKKTIAIPNGVSRKKLRRGIAPQVCDSIDLVTVGRFSYEKNIALSVSALEPICLNNIHYTIVGDGPERDKIIEAKKGNENIMLTGLLSRKQVLEVLSRASMVIMPSLWEGRSILMLEAMAFDVPLLLSDVPGLREPFDESCLKIGETFRRCSFGYLVETSNEEAYRNAVQDYISLSNEERDSMRSYIRGISKQNDMENVAERYISIFESL